MRARSPRLGLAINQGFLGCGDYSFKTGDSLISWVLKLVINQVINQGARRFGGHTAVVGRRRVVCQ